MSAVARKSSDVFDEDRTRQVRELSLAVFGRAPKRVAFPGGKTRSAFIADMGDLQAVFAQRDSKEDAQLEGIVLKALHKTGLVPALHSVAGEWVVQDFIAGERLPVRLHRTDDDGEREALMEGALHSLVTLQEAAHSGALQHRVPRIGTVDRWLWNRTGAAKRISGKAGITPPDLDREKLVDAMTVKRDEFVKWDARPGNAMVTQYATMWFDWEDCGRSKALDDLAYLLCDEWSNLSAEAEERLFSNYFPFFNRSLSQDHGLHYVRLFGITHMVLRMRLALKYYHREDSWWDRQYCLAGDKVGVTEQETSNLVARLRRWCDGVAEFAPLLPWLDDISERYSLS